MNMKERKEKKEYTDEELEEFRDKLNDEVPLRVIRKLAELNFDMDTVELEHTWKCAICGDEHFQIAANEAVPENIGSCDYCGWDECLNFNDWGERECPECTADYYHSYLENDTGVMCRGCLEGFSYHPEGTIVVYDPRLDATFKGIYVGKILQDFGEFDRDFLGLNEFDEDVQGMVAEIVGGSEYVSTDAWRGYNSINPKGDYAKELHSDQILSMSEDARNLKKFDDSLREVLEVVGIPYARVFTTTSNIFSTGYDVYILASMENKVNGVVEELKKAYRDPAAFRLTAVTGKDPEDCDENDKLLSVIASVMGM